MKHPRWSVIAVACLVLAACQDRRDPVKPTTAAAASAAIIVQAWS